ncbi:uncharacterized protein LOC128551127 [Mercenaria mercenaria]|uniref:uncharacterized protein LOC128551127 n=1 Tax=Mercenaria mercenaria TaxID=6596 RepID=UPI00234E92AA|nr:uncharacterized protein LOC128551127 [Mercenaria mercenaria]
MNSKSARRIKRPAKFTDGEVGNELTVTDRNAPYVTVQFAEEDLEKDIYFLGDLKGVDNKEVEAFSTLKLGQQILARCSGNVYWEATIKAINGTSVQDGDCPAVKKLRNDAKREKNIKVKKGKILVSENEENGHRNKHKQHSGQKKKEVVRIPADREADKKVSSNAQKKKGAENQGIVSRTKAYRPKTKPEVDFADYVIVEKNRTAPEGFQLLCEGASIAVRPMWLEELLATINKARTKKLKKAARQNRDVKEDESSEIIKRLIDGFFEPSELAVQGGTSVFKDNPVYLSLKRYAVHVLKTNKTKFRRAWNTKMCAARQTVDRLSGKQKSN